MTAPVATYRLQLSADFTFRDAARASDYLRALGVSHLYSSPVLCARRGSTHGYDVTDPGRLDPALGGADGFRDLSAALGAAHLRLLLDIVPNHMAASHENPWWWDVLRHGQASRYADHFDIDWSPLDPDLRGAVLLPVLGDPYGTALERGELRLERRGAEVVVRYHDRVLPLDPASLAPLLDEASAGAARDGVRGGPGVAGGPDAPRPAAAWAAEVRRLALALRRLPPRSSTEAGLRDERAESCRAVRDRLERLLEEEASFRAAFDGIVRVWNGTVGDPASFDALDGLLRCQAYRLAHWRVAAEEINYRRFFDIADLVALRVERPAVFADTHACVLELVRDGRVHGLRVDHVDGLRDPQGYLEHLADAPGARAADVWIEKILAPGEELPAEWPVAGTTGYDFLNALNMAYVDRTGLARLDAVYEDFVGEAVVWEDLLYAKKRQVIHDLFAGELRGLVRRVARLARNDRHARDLSTAAIERALVEVSACLPVYRTYWRGWVQSPEGHRPADQRVLEEALASARRRGGADAGALDFLARVLDPPPASAPRPGGAELLGQAAEWEEVVLRWQQFTGPATAKGLEDTALYLFNRLVSLNVVGSEPGDVDLSLSGLHDFLGRRARLSPLSLNTTSTHDSKRSEDVRARINVLSELPDEWESALVRWAELNRSRKEEVRGRPVPGANEEVLLYQTLLGSWPLDDADLEGYPDRIVAFAIKAAREAKENTSWLQPDAEYESALEGFVRRVVGAADFRRAFLPLERRVAHLGALNSLSQVVLKVGAPGVPDFYQGADLWALSLVDPDNRRPVDFAARARMLEELRRRQGVEGPADLAGRLLREWPTGLVKLHLMERALAARRAAPELFAGGSYIPLEARGVRGRSVFAFLRRRGETWALAAAGVRFARVLETGEAPLGAAWGETVLELPDEAPRRWRDALTDAGVRVPADRRLRVPDLFRVWPVALLLGSVG